MHYFHNADNHGKMESIKLTLTMIGIFFGFYNKRMFLERLLQGIF